MSPTGYSFDCSLRTSGVALDTIQDKQMLKDFLDAKRGGTCSYSHNPNPNFSPNSIKGLYNT